MPIGINAYPTSSTLSCLPGQGFGETASHYYMRSGGFNGASYSTNIFARTSSEESITYVQSAAKNCTGVSYQPSAPPESTYSNVELVKIMLHFVPHDTKPPAPPTTTNVVDNKTAQEVMRKYSETSRKSQPDNTSECSARSKSSFQRFSQWLLRCLFPCVKSQK